MANPHPADPGQPAEHPEAHATVEQPGATAADHAAPAAFWLITAPMFISLAMILVIALIVWKKVPAAIGKALDSKIDVIRNQLAEAETLRKDAEALRAEYEAKRTSADTEAAAIVERARHEADAIVAQAKTNAEALVERRQRMAEDKIAAEERSAVEQLRAAAADAARQAAAQLIRERVDEKADEALVADAIRGIGAR
jgi:F-type H+-transporting ATPase subunit b